DLEPFGEGLDLTLRLDPVADVANDRRIEQLAAVARLAERELGGNRLAVSPQSVGDTDHAGRGQLVLGGVAFGPTPTQDAVERLAFHVGGVASEQLLA